MLYLLAIVALLVAIEALRNTRASGMSEGMFGDNRGPQSRVEHSLLPERNADPRIVRFGSFNLHMGRSADEKPALRRTISIVDAVDVISLQEVGGGGWDGTENHALNLARRAGNRHWSIAPTRLRWFRPRGGNAVISTYPMTDAAVMQLAGNRRDFRNLISFNIDLDGQQVTCINTHIATGRHADLQVRQFQQAIDLFLASSPAVLMADMNMRPEQARIRAILEQNDVIDALGVVAKRENRPEIKPADDVDWILVRGLEVVGAGRVPPGISDHPMIWADLRLKP